MSSQVVVHLPALATFGVSGVAKSVATQTRTPFNPKRVQPVLVGVQSPALDIAMGLVTWVTGY